MPPEDNKVADVFLAKGMPVRARLPKIFIDVQGGFRPQGPVVLQAAFDVVPTWLHLAFEHLIEAQRRAQEVHRIWQSSDGDLKQAALEAEFHSAMQASMASAIALDAFYASVRARIEIPKQVLKAWKGNKTPRYVQVAETLRLAFTYNERSAREVREALKGIFRLRDEAVHPAATFKDTLVRHDLNIGVEWRFAQYCFASVHPTVRLSLSLISQLTSIGVKKHEELTEYCRLTKPRIDALVQRWEAEYGPLQP